MNNYSSTMTVVEAPSVLQLGLHSLKTTVQQQHFVTSTRAPDRKKTMRPTQWPVYQHVYTLSYSQQQYRCRAEQECRATAAAASYSSAGLPLEEPLVLPFLETVQVNSPILHVVDAKS